MGFTRQRAHGLVVLGAIVTLIASFGIVPTPAQASTPSAYAWGFNRDGQLGNGTTTDSTTPTAVISGITFTSITAGYIHTCALAATGAAYCWGDNSGGRLGNGTTTNSTTPIPISMPVGVTFTSITAGDSHTCALATTGDAYCWGRNTYGELGDGFQIDRTTPTAVSMPAGTTFTSITAGGGHTCALAVSGAAYCWGLGVFGQLGDGSVGPLSTTPGAVTGGLTFTSITAGFLHTCALTTTGAAYCWGNNANGRLGNGTTTNSTTPTTAIGGLAFTSITAGSTHTCALTTIGAAYCWGANSQGQLGDGTLAPTTTPTAIVGGLTFTSITAGDSYTCALTATGAAYCWGANFQGQLGDGSLAPTTTPAAVSGGLVFAAVVTGSSSLSTFGILLTRASGNNVPTAPLQQFGRTEVGTCEQQPADLLDFPGVSHLNGQSWGPSWAQWPNGGTGGFVCNRQPYYTNNGSWAVE